MVRSIAFGFALLLAATVAAAADTSVTTQHNDNARTGANLSETILTPQVVARGMARVDRLVDGLTYGQVLYAHGVKVGDSFKNIAYVVTSTNSVYAFDADDTRPGPLTGLIWRRTLVDRNRLFPRAIWSTPVLELADGAGTIDVVYSAANHAFGVAIDAASEMLLESSNLDVRYYVVKLDLASGRIALGPVPLQAQVTDSDGNTVPFSGANQWDKPALLLDHGYLYLSFGMRHKEEVSPYYGWMLRYRADTLQFAGAFNVSPNAYVWRWNDSPAYDPVRKCYAARDGRLKRWDLSWVRSRGVGAQFCSGEGGGIWQGGGGPAADAAGNVYVATGNGHYAPDSGSYGNAVVKLTSTADKFEVAASFAPSERRDDMESYDVDLGSAGPVLLESENRVIAGGKPGIFYVLDADMLLEKQHVTGGINTYDPSGNTRYTWNLGPHFHGSPTVWRQSPTSAFLYEWAEKDYLKKYRLENGVFSNSASTDTWAAQGPFPATNCRVKLLNCIDAMPGGMLALSANGTTPGTGIVWALLRKHAEGGRDEIYAFDADTLSLIWHEPIGFIPGFAGPTVADGKVFVPTNSLHFYIYRPAGPQAEVKIPSLKRNFDWLPVDAMKNMMMKFFAKPAAQQEPDYSADPTYRARIRLTRLIPVGFVPSKQLLGDGFDVYTCAPDTCTRVRTDLLRLDTFDAASSTAAVSLRDAGPASRAVSSYGAAEISIPWEGAPDWQQLRAPGGAFGSAAYVVRSETVGAAPPTTRPKGGSEVKIRVQAVYTEFTAAP